MAQHYDNAAKYVMLEHSQEFAEFVVGHSNITVLERLETEKPTLKAHQNDSTLKVQLPNETAHPGYFTSSTRHFWWLDL